MDATAPQSNAPSSLDAVLHKLVNANHILHYHGVVDAYGHISVRNPEDPTAFFISKGSAPALVAGRDDIEIYRVSDASAINPGAPEGYSERFIHSEIYKKYSDVNAVIHSHNDAVLPFSITSLPLRPVYHMGSVMGSRVPVFDISLHYKATDSIHSLLVNNEHLGAALATGLNPSSLTTKVLGYITSSTSENATWPPHTTVLMRGHGFTCIGASIEEAVFRAVFTCNNARIQTTAMTIQATHNLGKFASSFGAETKTPNPAELESMSYLNDKECKDTWATMSKSIARPWKLWCLEVANSDLYKNEISLDESQ